VALIDIEKASYIFGAFIIYLMVAFISDILGNNLV